MNLQLQFTRMFPKEMMVWGLQQCSRTEPFLAGFQLHSQCLLLSSEPSYQLSHSWLNCLSRSSLSIQTPRVLCNLSATPFVHILLYVRFTGSCVCCITKASLWRFVGCLYMLELQGMSKRIEQRLPQLTMNLSPRLSSCTGLLCPFLRCLTAQMAFVLANRWSKQASFYHVATPLGHIMSSK